MTRLMLAPFALAMLCAVAACAALPGGAFESQKSPAVRRGESLAQTVCAACHAMRDGEAGRNAMAPTFQQVRMRYNELSLKRQLMEISTSGHYLMKPVRMEPSDMEDLIAYIESLEE